MQADFSADRPIFLQLAERLEAGIASGAYPEEAQVPSITEFSVAYGINPATALKGVNLLVEAGFLYKKRGLGMFDAAGARAKLLQKRRDKFIEDFVQPMFTEARHLAIDGRDLKQIIERGLSGYDN
ncbi:MAG: GntR family transcriptional regulator [Clostridia bacterium]|nr:GntR family transcriptional regulator [Clostridia bacterium]